MYFDKCYCIHTVCISKVIIYYILFRGDVRFCVVISVLLLSLSSKKNVSYFRDIWVGRMMYIVKSDVAYFAGHYSWYQSLG